MHDLAARLRDWRQRKQIVRKGEARLLCELAARSRVGRFTFVEFAFGNRPRAVVFALPERPAGMHEKNFDVASSPTERKDSSALRAGSQRSNLRSGCGRCERL